MFASIYPSELFQKMMVSVFQKYEGTVIFLDDTGAHGASREEHNQRLEAYGK
jgi:hypothetical protein